MTSEHIKAEYARILDQTKKKHEKKHNVIQAIITAVDALKDAGLPVSTNFEPIKQQQIEDKTWYGGITINETKIHIWVYAENFYMVGNKFSNSDTHVLLPYFLQLTATIEAEETAKNKRMVSPVKTAAESKTKWQKLSASEVARISDHPALDRRLTDIFNFETREHTHISQNLTTGAESTSLREFDTIRDKTLLQQALDAFTRDGGKADLRVIETNFVNRRMEPLFHTTKADKPATP